MVKGTLLGAAALFLFSGAAAQAQVNLELNVGDPGYVEARPAYVTPYPSYYDPRHRDRDFRYWREQRRREHGERHEAYRDEHDRR